MEFFDQPHRRYNILSGEWILCSPHRTKRPWQGKVEEVNKVKRESYDQNCYLCPTNMRMGEDRNPNYPSTFVFKNDFGALLEDTVVEDFNEGLLTARSEKGICKVICFSPNHALTIADMEVSGIVDVISTWQAEYFELGGMDDINHVQIFENKGEIMGCSNPHPHGQIWAQASIPMEIQKKATNQLNYFLKNKTSLLQNYLEQEIKLNIRIIAENADFVALVPFWAVWPYEAMIIPRRHMTDITMMTETEKDSFAQILKSVTSKYDKLFDVSFPYSMGIHQRPTDGEIHEYWHWHVSFYPPLLRSASVKKFMVGYEMFGEAQRDITAEYAAQVLAKL